jgi:hypothetical protein
VPTLALALLFQAAAAAPVATPTPTPVLKRTPVAASGNGRTRTLSDVARERKLQEQSGGAPSKAAGLTVAPEGGGIGGKGLPAASGTPAATPTGTPVPGTGPVIVVESAQHNNTVGTSGQVHVYGTVRNAGDAQACDVSIAVQLYDDRDRYLASGSGRLDEPVLKPGMRSSYSVMVQVPPGVAGSLREKDLSPGIIQGSVTLEGKWQTLGRAEAEVISAGGPCPGEKPPEEPAPKEPEPTPAPAPTPPAR